MRIVQAGTQQYVALDPDHEVIRNLVRQAGFRCAIQEQARALVLEVTPLASDEAILLFDASDASNLGWFSRCHFYVDGLSGAVLQSPLTVANCFQSGRVTPNRLRVALAKEVPAGFRLPGKQSISEQVVYALLYNFLSALRDTGVAICGIGSVAPLAGRRSVRSRW